ncbi:fimbrial protein [Kluyvera cryocrescens]|uniref:Fimbrial protein n=1 Tax=Kluyvera cryocrescens TaxID=580 RepID=A0AAW9CES8_KLUCR|nr:fimbrial protein [Kluyvera cryocrescens]MDW3779437.1 fimbrial protein [Kluyvera cryocrescens]
MRYFPILITGLLAGGLHSPSAVSAPVVGGNIDVTFKATVADTTCVINVVGGSGDGKNQTVVIGDSSGEVSMESVVNGDSAATASFSLQATECPAAGTPSYFTTIQADSDPQAGNMLLNQAEGPLAAQGLGISLSRADSLDTPLILNQKLSYGDFGWQVLTQDNFTQSVEARMVARIAVTSAVSSAKAGSVQATAVFHFDYN